MPQRGWFNFIGRWFMAQCLVVAIGCESAPREHMYTIAANPAQSAGEVNSTQLNQEDSQVPEPPEQVPTRPVGPTATQPAYNAEEILAQIPDPQDEADKIARELDKPDVPSQDKWKYNQLLERLNSIRRPKVIRLSLAEAINRALRNNYRIQISAYSPAIKAAQIVEAEAQFDAVFFTNFTNNKQDRPSASQLQATFMQTRDFEAGVRKLLSAGTQVQISYALDRSETNLAFQTLNPSYFNQLNVEFRQPFLRGFGLDFNRSKIELAKLDRNISIEELSYDIQEKIFGVESVYWSLSHSRRTFAVQAHLLTELEIIFHYLEQRAKIGYDVYSVQLNLTKSEILDREANLRITEVLIKNNEKALKQLMNDPDLNLAQDDIEIMPTEVPTLEPVVLDELGEVTDALTHRPDLRKAKLEIEKTQLAIGVAKNQALPRLDVLLRYIIDGLGANPDRAFSQLSKNDFQEYVIMLEFEWPIGNRGPEAKLRQARLQQAQAIAAHRAAIEGVIYQIKNAIRTTQKNYDLIGVRLESAYAREKNVYAIQARQERRDPPSLDLELNAHINLAYSRINLLDSVVLDYPHDPDHTFGGYTIRFAELEKLKGTLLRYYNIVIKGADDESCLKPYRPIGP